MKITKTVHPIREVILVEVTERRGKEINPFVFWLAREFILRLDCSHQQARVRDVYSSGSLDEVKASLPKRVRCTECPGVERPVKVVVKPIPEFDPMAVALGKAIASADPEREAEMLRWIAAEGGGMEDTALVYANVALAVIDVLLERVHDPRAIAVRNAVAEWGERPTPENRKALTKSNRRLYSAQHSVDGEWFAVRGIIEARKATPEGILASLTWMGEDRDQFFARLWEARAKVDAEAVSTQPGDEPGDALTELSRIWAEEQPGISVESIPMLDYLIECYGKARHGAHKSA